MADIKMANAMSEGHDTHMTISTSHNEKVERSIDFTDVERKAIVRKIDKHLMPLMFISYLLQFLDKASLGYTAILGIQRGTGLIGTQYSWVSSAFFFGYLVASYPASLGFIRFPLGKYLAVFILMWAVTLACHGAASTFVTLTALRVLLGVLESTITPGFTIVTGIWYKQSEHALRHGIWFAGNATGTMFGGLLAYAMANIKSSIAPWRWLFIIFGIVTFVWGIIVLLFMPDSPLTARFLTPAEREYANRRPQAALRSFKSTEWKKDQFYETLIDPKTWLVFIYVTLNCIPATGLTNFSSIIVQGFGFSTLTTLLLGIPSSFIVLVFVLGSAYAGHKLKYSRCYIIVANQLIGLVGVLLIQQLPANHKVGRLIGVWLYGVFSAGTPLALSLISSNFAGFTKKTTAAAIVFIGYCGGSIAGPQIFYAWEAPHYPSAFTAILVCMVLATVSVLVLRQVMVYQNSRRNRIQGFKIDPEIASRVQGEEVFQGQEVDETDWQNAYFRYYL